jgi:ketosteroid isomerase-like protein
MNRKNAILFGPLAILLSAAIGSPAMAGPEDDRRAVAALDTAYQAAVGRNDVETMARILHDDMVVVLGNGTVETRADLLREARAGLILYERQVEVEGTQNVRLFGADTAVVTALLWIKGRRAGQSFDRRLWFSDTYVRTADGWRYALGQASLPLPSD